MEQTAARKTLKDAPIMWRRINSIGMILDCNSTYAASLGYAKSEVLGRPIFEHVPKESWEAMNNSLKAWFETGQVNDRKITFKKHDGTTFPGLLQATSIYDGNGHLLGSNTAIFNLTELTDERIGILGKYFTDTTRQLAEIGATQRSLMDETSKSEYDGLKEMFEMLSGINLHELRDA